MNGGKFAIKIRKEVWLIVLLIIAGIAAVFFLRQQSPRISRAEPVGEVEKTVLPEPIQPMRQFKILHIMSYHSPWEWTDSQFQGFKDALRDLDIEYKVIQMDAKRHSSEQWKLKVAAEARETYRHLEAGPGVHR